MPMVLSLMLCTVTFPVVAQASRDGDIAAARARVERDLGARRPAWCSLGAAAIVACAPQIIEILFQRGAFTAEDTAATASVMRVYALGLLGQTLVGALVRSLLLGGAPHLVPDRRDDRGHRATAGSGSGRSNSWGVSGHRRRQRVGITLTAVLLLAGDPDNPKRQTGSRRGRGLQGRWPRWASR